MCYVVPVWLLLDGIIEGGCPSGEFPNGLVIYAPRAFGIGVSLCDVFLNPLLKPIQTKDEVLAELMAEHVALKKEIGEL
jgi:hypothetical protein